MSSERRTLVGPTGEPISTRVTDVAPKELHGFKVTLGLGPYPPQNRNAKARAVYAELVPEHPDVKKRMRANGKERILGIVQVTPQAAAELRLNPRGAMAEAISRRALAEAAKLARTVSESAGGRATSHAESSPDLFPGAEGFEDIANG